MTQAVKDHDAALWEKESKKVLGCLRSASGALDGAARLASQIPVR